MLIAALVLWAGQALAEPSQPPYSADALYNQANAYARAGKPGLAVLSYERATLLAPDDPDIKANLAYVRASAQVLVKPQSRYAPLGEATNSAAAAWLGVLGIALVGTGLIVRRAARRLLWIPGGVLLLGVALIALTTCNAILLWPRMHEAVVLVDQTPARVSPAPMADTAFVLREAESVTMAAEHEGFMLIRTGGGLSGWVSSANLGAVVPSDGGQRSN
jgi:hypothetical protein